MLVLGMGLGLVGPGTPHADPAPRVPSVIIEPNAIQSVTQKMKVTLTGLAGQTVYLQVLRDCDNDLREPELPDGRGCTAARPVWKVELQRDETTRTLEVPFDGLPAGKPLWLRVSATADGKTAYRQALFGLLSDAERCTVWRALLGLVGLSHCKPEMGPVLMPSNLGSHDNRPSAPLEVRRLVPRGADLVVETVVGTRGATGVAWDGAEGREALLVTVRALGEREGKGTLGPGLWRLDLGSRRRELLVSAAAGITLAAPLALGDGRVAYVREAEGEPGGAGVSLVVWGTAAKGGKPAVVAAIPLPYPVHQLLAVDARRGGILGYSRVEGLARLWWADLRAGSVTELGFDERLYRAALRAADGRTALAFEDAAGKSGWELVLVDDEGELVREVAVGPGDALLPAWRGDGRGLAFVATAPAEAVQR
ncbi:MAG TPA: hypothetical protein VH877_30415 [Polyangia bacterium]|nr:hypothetical protein [Polyangia bacterium]